MSMVLSTTTFARDPFSMDMIRPEKICQSVLTYSSVQYFSWGSTIVGKQVNLRWNAMPSTMFDALDTLYTNDTVILWDPNIPGKTGGYNVNILDLNGDYYISQESSAKYWRINCVLSLLIMSTAST